MVGAGHTRAARVWRAQRRWVSGGRDISPPYPEVEATQAAFSQPPLIRRCGATFPKGEGRALFMRIRRQLVIAVLRFGVQTQQLEACENQQCRNDNIRYAGDDVVGVAVAHKIAQQRIEPV